MNSIDNKDDKKGGIRERVKAMEDMHNFAEYCIPPKSLKIEVAASCNLKCEFCFHKNCRRSGLMTKNDFLTAIKIAKDLKIPQVGLLFLGEPTMNPELPELIRIAKEDYQIPYVFVTTNGVSSETMIQKLMESPLDSLKWSINQPTAKAFKEATGVNGFNQLMKNIKLAASLTKNTKLYASSAVYDVNKVDKEMATFIDAQVRPYVYEHYYFKINNQGGLIQDDHFTVAHCNRLPVIPCPRIFNNSYITYDLKVALCCCAFTNDFIIGDLRKESFTEIWNGERIRELRRAHLAGNVNNTICGGQFL